MSNCDCFICIRQYLISSEGFIRLVFFLLLVQTALVLVFKPENQQIRTY